MFWKSFGKYRVVYSHLWQTYGQSWYVRISFLMQIVGEVSKLVLLPFAIALIITRMTEHDFAAAGQAVLMYVGASLVIGVLNPLRKYIAMKGENVIYEEATKKYFSRLIRNDIEFFNDNLSGYLTTATRQYVDTGINLVRALRENYTETLSRILLPLIVITWIDWLLGLITILLSVTQAAYMLWASHAIGPYRKKSVELFKRNSGFIADAISNALAIKATAQEDTASKAVSEGARQEAIAFTQRWSLQSKLVVLRETITVIFFVGLLGLTVWRASDGTIEITAAILTVTYATTILAGLYRISQDLDEHDDFVDKLIPTLDIFNRQNSVVDAKRPKKLGKVRGEIEFTDVLFAYSSGGEKVFNGLNLKIPAGQKVGVVGLSGAGKSTLIKLLLRFDDVQDGSVTVDGLDVRDVRQAELRRNIAYVPQEPLLFHASIRENVILSKSDATDKEVQRALETAHAWQFVKRLPERLDSIVGERGVKLSGGQKQRIAIARAVLQKSSIIVLDEATSALDSESEQIIKDSFASVLKGKTAIVVAHRLSTLSEMDRIIVLDDGKLLEDGTHKSLMAKNGTYAKLYRRQQRHLDIDEPTPVN